MVGSAKQSNPLVLFEALDCFVALLLAMAAGSGKLAPQSLGQSRNEAVSIGLVVINVG